MAMSPCNAWNTPTMIIMIAANRMKPTADPRTTSMRLRSCTDPSSAVRPATPAGRSDDRTHHGSRPRRRHHPFGMRFPASGIIPSGGCGGGRPGALLEPVSTGEEGGTPMGGPVEAGRGGQGRKLRAFDRRLLGRAAVARRTLTTYGSLLAALLIGRPGVRRRPRRPAQPVLAVL